MSLKEVKMVIIDNKIYLLSGETNNDDFVFSVNGDMVIGAFDDLLGDQIDWVMNVAIQHEQIGLIYDGLELNEYHRIVQLNGEHIAKIMNNNGRCFIEMVNPINQEHKDIELGSNIFEPILIDGKVIIHLDNESEM